MKKLLSCALAFILLLSACGMSNSGAQSTISVYYLRKTEYRTDGELLTPEKLSVAAGENGVEKAVKAIAAVPADEKLQSPLPTGVTITDAALADGTVSVGLSENYLDAAPIDQAVLKSCLTLTLCSLSDVSSVSLHVGSETVEEKLQTEDVLLTNTVISPQKAQVRLYFPRTGGKTLGSEYRTITTDENNTAERRILEAILAGPEDQSLSRAFPVGTIVGSVYTQDSVCTVSLSGISPDESGRTQTEGKLAAYSLVDSLTALAGVKSVQILVDGKTCSSLWGFDISRPLMRGGESD